MLFFWDQVLSIVEVVVVLSADTDEVGWADVEAVEHLDRVL